MTREKLFVRGKLRFLVKKSLKIWWSMADTVFPALVLRDKLRFLVKDFSLQSH